ncbi:ATP-binding cassette domain-containing protein [Glycomyces harbinensis]|uniref:ABC transporter n=1 Tax=Glycomyces harbinensis TaxID=58114 RepID=A0A1G6YP55_9ACTN|nr:ATP-binding cassette domain-containing protein [Glycomyces harbinensis]SDD92072.1 ABC transporter [Glycomyces harbinensis]
MSDRSDDGGPVPEVSGGDGAEAAPPKRAENGVPDHDALGHNAAPTPASELPGAATPASDALAPESPTPEVPALEAPAWVETPGDAAVDPVDPVDPAEPTGAGDASTRILPAADGAAAAPVPVPLSEAEHTALLEHANGTPFLQARGLSSRGRQGPIFTGVTLTAGLGQVVAICGDGGDGRSSLLLALTGRFAFQSGELEVDGQTRPGQIRRRFTIAQAGPPIRFDPYHTVASCIKETIAVSKGAATRANINAWLDRLAVGVDTGDTFGFLPRIDQIRFAVACAAACRTPAIAVDDADSGLDTCGAERVFEALRTVADAGQLVLAACTRSDPPADAVVDLRGQHASAAPAHRRGDHAPPRRHRHEADRNGGHQ